MPTPSIRRGRRWPRVAAGVLLALGVAVAGCEAAGWPFLREPLQRLMTSAAAVPVTFGGDMRLRLIGAPRLSVEHLQVGAADGVGAPYLFDADGIHLAWHWGELRRWQQGGALRLQELRADRLDAWLVREADGRASWHIGGPDTTAALPTVDVLVLSRARIEVDDRQGDTRLRVDVQGSATEVDGEPPSGGYRVTAAGRYAGQPLSLEAQAGALLPLLSSEPAPPVPLRVEAALGRSRLAFDGGAAALLGGRRIDGELRLRAPSLATVGELLGLPLPATPPFEADGHLRLGGDVVQLSVARFASGRSRLAGEFRFDRGPTPPLLSGQLSGQRLAFADLGPAVGVPAEPVRARPSARVLPQREFDLPSLTAMNADVQFAIDELDFGTPALRPLRSVRTRLLLQGGVLQLDELRAEVAGGTVAGSTQLDGTREAARWQARLDFDGLDVATWVHGLQKTGASRPASVRRAAVPSASPPRAGSATATREPPAVAYLTGELQLRLDVTGSGRSTAAILSTLDGTAQARLRNGSLSHLTTELVGLDVAQALGVAVSGDKALALNCARMDLRIEDGIAEPRVALMDNRDSTLRATGRVDLRDEQLALRLVARPKDVSLASLRSPVLVRGTLAKPAVQVEPAPLAARVAAAVALGVVATPAAAILPLIDLGDPEGGDPCRQADAPTPAASASAAAARPRKGGKP